MPKITPAEAAQKWATRTSSATADVQRGIERTTKDPGKLAAAAADKWHAKVTAAKPKYATNVGAVSQAEWKASALAGVNRIASGVQAKVGKMERFQTAFFAHLAQAEATIGSMPTSTIDQSIAKMVAQVRHNAAFKRSGPR